MRKVDVLIAGGGDGGLAVFRVVKTLRPDWEVAIVKPEKGFTFKCPLRYYISGEIGEPNVLHDDEHMFHGATLIYAKLVGGDPKEKIAELDNGEKIRYEKLVLATGSKPHIPNIPSVDLEGVHALRYFPSAKAIAEEAKQASSVVVVGAGYIATDLADCFKKMGLEVSLVVRSRVLRTSIDSEFSTMVEEHLTQHGVKVVKGSPVKILGARRAEGVLLDSGAEVKGDFIVFATGIRPVVEPAANLGAAIGYKGIIVDDRLETTLRDVYAVGEVAEVRHMITGESMTVGTAAAAMAQGDVAGFNICGFNIKYPGGLSCLVTKIFDLYIGAAGLTEDQARAAGFKPIVEKAEYLDHYTVYPGGKKYWARMIYDSASGRLVGAQFAGYGNVADKVEAAALAIRFGATIADLATHYSAAFPAATFNPRFNQFREPAKKIFTEKVKQ